MIWRPHPRYSYGVRLLLILLVLLLSACRDGPTTRRLVDGGRFELPDSGVFFDARPAPTAPDAAPRDTGPHVCESGCPDGSVCGCLDDEGCGCHAPRAFDDTCDPQHPETCGWPYECKRGRKIDGLTYICTDGREGSSCSTVDSICNTSRGCICANTPFGTACSCQGTPGPNPLLCNLNDPATCPGGTCVRVETPGGVTFICSQGRRYEPCVLGDQTCRTSLGCTCPRIEGRDVCQCSEPATQAGEPCDLREPLSCEAPLRCTPVQSEQPGTVSTVCTSGFGRDAGTDPLACDPARPFCPPNTTCEEVFPGNYRCVPRT